MPFQQFQFKPGIYTESSKTDTPDRYVDGNHVRFYKGFPKKIGGRVKSTFNQFLGVCRGIVSWVTLGDAKYTALGTNLKLYINSGGVFFDITPWRVSGTLGANPFTTTITSSLVSVASTAHGVLAGDYVDFSGATAVGGITPNGDFVVTTVTDANNFIFQSSQTATSSASGGGAAVAYGYEISPGSVDSYSLQGWGGGGFGSGTFGTPRTLDSIVPARTWSVDNYGEDLIASPRSGAIYKWVASDGLTVRAQVVSAAPETNLGVVVSGEDRYVIALGAFDGSENDPMLIRWSSQNDINDWTPTTTNTAGDTRLSDGNLIMTGVLTRGQLIISTDTAVYAMYPDTVFVFAFKTLGIGGAVSPHAMIENNGIVYWFSINNFYYYNGTINVLNCDVRSYVYDSLNLQQIYKVYAGVNTEWNEIWWLYPSADSTENDRYVAVNYLDGTWHYGSWALTSWLDKGVVNSTPISTGSDSYQYAQESGVDDNGAALATSLTTGSPQLDHRNKYIFVKKIIPNFKSLTGNMNVQVETQFYPQGTASDSTAYTFDSSTTYISTRARGDEFLLVFSSDEVGSDFWGGTITIEYMGVGSR